MKWAVTVDLKRLRQAACARVSCVTCIDDFLPNKKPLRRTAFSHSSFSIAFKKKTWCMQYVDKSDLVLRWQLGCARLSGEWCSIIRKQETDNLYVPLRTPSPALQMEAQCNFHLWIYRKANSIRCLPTPQTHPELLPWVMDSFVIP